MPRRGICACADGFILFMMVVYEQESSVLDLTYARVLALASVPSRSKIRTLAYLGLDPRFSAFTCVPPYPGPLISSCKTQQWPT